jgi:hypothetical protein
MSEHARQGLDGMSASMGHGQEDASERRDTGRSTSGVSCACSVITLQQRPPFWPAQIRDVSARGIGLLTSRAMQPGCFLAIHFNKGTDKPLRARVVHSTIRSNELGYVVGCSLSRKLNDDELDALL